MRSLKAGTVIVTSRMTFVERDVVVCVLQNSVTALHVASKWGHRSMIQLLLNNGAHIDCRTGVCNLTSSPSCREVHNLCQGILVQRRTWCRMRVCNSVQTYHLRYDSLNRVGQK